MLDTPLTVPSARVAPVAHAAVIVTLELIVPVAYVGVQAWEDGWLVTYTVYFAPLVYDFVNVFVLLFVNVSVSPWSSCICTVPESPVTVTLTVNPLDELEQVAVTVTFEVMVPFALLLRVQFCPAGCVFTDTE